jgi:hypothetical protein
MESGGLKSDKIVSFKARKEKKGINKKKEIGSEY